MKRKKLNYHIIIILLFSFSFLSCDNSKNIKQEYNSNLDSIAYWIKQSRDKNLTIIDRNSSLRKAHVYAQKFNNDSIKARKLSTIAYRYYALNDTITFKKVNAEALNIASKIQDSFTIADIHWSYADFNNLKETYSQSYYHFNEAYKYFNKTYKQEAARMLMYMAFIKGRYRDYTGSEILLIQAIKTFKELNLNRFLFEAYSDLAFLQNDIKEYNRAIDYHKKALNYLEKVKNKDLYVANGYNNAGVTYLMIGEYSTALEYFNNALKYDNNMMTHARIIGNRGYTKFKMGDTVDVKNDLFRALLIRDSINDKSGILINKIRISDYYTYYKDTTNAIKYAKEANTLAKELKNGRDYLRSLKQLARLDKINEKKYLEEHISYSDSLIAAERKALDKFTRIEFETDEVIQQNEKLTQQQVLILFISSAVILALIFVYFLKVQKAKNEKLVLETEQQKANEQVYLLTLKQQATLEEERTRERNRISQELHDGILGRLFGTRVGMGFLDLEADEETKKQHESFLEELQDIEKEIREVSHKLNTNFDSADINFTNIINQLLESKSQIGDFQFQLNIDSNISWKSTDEIIKVNVYRIIQESLQNTIKHANANYVSLEFSSDKTYLNIVIKDDGVGFNIQKSKKGIGLKNIRSRVQKMNGTLDIKSAMNKGTLIHIKIPIVQT